MPNNAKNNNPLYRPLLQGDEFNALFVPSTCKTTQVGTGDTNFGFHKIRDLIYKNLDEIDTQEAKRLFLKPTVQETCHAVLHFIYNHFQYKIDSWTQTLQFPACAWATRHEGMDCKSYTILASSLLLKIGVKNYIRRIKQPNDHPDHYTHIYVVVPEDQNTGSLGQSYYVIDGLNYSSLEPFILEKHDIFMDLPYIALNGSIPLEVKALFYQKQLFLTSISSYLDQRDLTALDNHITSIIKSGGIPTYQQTNYGYLVSGAKVTVPVAMNGISFSNVWGSIGGLFGNIGCWGGSAFSGGAAEQAGEAIVQFFTKIIDDINNAIKNGAYGIISEKYADFEAYAEVAIQSYEAKRAEGWNKCSTENIDKMLATLRYFQGTVYQGLTAWLNEAFLPQNAGKKRYDVRNGMEEHGFYFSYTGNGHVVLDIDLYKWVRNPMVTHISAFEFTPYITQSASNPDGFDPSAFLQTLNETLAEFPINTGSNSGSNIGSNSGNTNSNGQTPNNNGGSDKDKPLISTTGKVVIGLSAAALLAWGGNKYLKSKKENNDTTSK